MIPGDFSTATGRIRTFDSADYVLFALTLILSGAVGIFYALKDRNENTTGEFLLGGRDMRVLPVSLSMMVTFLSALTILGVPVEIYNYNTMFWWLLVSLIFAIVGSVVVFIPVFYNMKVTSVFEYLEQRFSKGVRMLGSIVFSLQMMIYMGFVLYAPSLALNAVTKLSLWGSISSIGLVCIFYTTVGGIKAVLWTDTLQFVLIITGLLALLIQGSIVVNGFSTAWDIAARNQRIYFTNFSPNPATRHSVWSIVIGAGFFWLALYGSNQAQVQRACTCPTLKKAKLDRNQRRMILNGLLMKIIRALLINLFGLMFIINLTCMIGVVIYAFYSGCDPVSVHLITSSDQLVPLFVMDVLGQYKGLPGLFLASVFSGSLSTLSSGLNSMAAVILEDFVRGYCFQALTEKRALLISKFLVIGIGLINLGTAFLISKLSDMLQVSYSLYSILSGPMLGLFALGMFFPWANKWGASGGLLISLVMMMWIGFGAQVNKISGAVKSPVRTDECFWNFTETLSNYSAPAQHPGLDMDSNPVLKLYTMSYVWYCPLGMLILVVSGLIISFVTGHTNPSEVDSKLMCPIFDKLFPCLPERVLKVLRFGVVYKDSFNLSSRPFQISQKTTDSKTVVMVKHLNMTDVSKKSSSVNGSIPKVEAFQNADEVKE